ncbi:MAG: hydrogenase expression/formation protein, partial [Zoogloeaceae bacterium]|nr:hydrogenase expression/formation protein [Zoogloeaceae bacterium]
MPSRSIPIPVVAENAAASAEAPEYLSMPHDMATFAAPRLPEDFSRATLAAVLDRLRDFGRRAAATEFAAATGVTEDLSLWESDERALLGDLLGFGEVSAYTATSPIHWRIQETAFPALWRVLALEAESGGDGGDEDEGIVRADFLQAGEIPPILRQIMRERSQGELPLPAFPDGVMNAPALAREILLRANAWREGETAHVINFTLLPVNAADLDILYDWLGHREVAILSRGYGNCRITSTRLRNAWWVQYFNSMDTLILNTLEITAMPEAALA